MRDSDGTAALLSDWPRIASDVEAVYRHLHSTPELSFDEHSTAATVADRLSTQGFTVHRGLGGTGVVAELSSGGGPSVLLRAELDALPVTEQTGLPYASTVTVQRETEELGVMHACGHDLHMASLLGATQLLSDHTDQWSGRVVAVFQPAEELGAGAAAMVADGLQRLVGDVDVAFAQHVMALPSGSVYLRPGPALSTATIMRVVVHGRSAHASVPNSGIDAVLLAAMIVVRLQGVVSRECPPHEFSVITVGALHAGTVANAIADRATLELSLRSYSDEGLHRLMEAVKRICLAESEASRAPSAPEFEVGAIFPMTQNDAAVTSRVTAAMSTNLGSPVRELPPQSASEDFAHIAAGLDAPYCYWGLGGLPQHQFTSPIDDPKPSLTPDAPTNHSPLFAPEVQPTLEIGTKALVIAAMEWLGE